MRRQVLCGLCVSVPLIQISGQALLAEGPVRVEAVGYGGEFGESEEQPGGWVTGTDRMRREDQTGGLGGHRKAVDLAQVRGIVEGCGGVGGGSVCSAPYVYGVRPILLIPFCKWGNQGTGW